MKIKMINKIILITLFFLSFNVKAQETEQNQGLKYENLDNSRFFSRALIQILDKATAKAIDVEVKVGSIYKFKNIDIKIHKCWQAPLDQKPDSKILIEVIEKIPTSMPNSVKDKELKNKIFYGWMIASSPSVSGLEHPIYDIVALNCKN